MNPTRKPDKETPPTMPQSFFKACLLILCGVIALIIALELLAHYWGWLLLIGALVLAVWITIRVYRAKKNRW